MSNDKPVMDICEACCPGQPPSCADKQTDCANLIWLHNYLTLVLRSENSADVGLFPTAMAIFDFLYFLTCRAFTCSILQKTPNLECKRLLQQQHFLADWIRSAGFI